MHLWCSVQKVHFFWRLWKFSTCYSPGQCAQKNYIRTMNMCAKCVYPQSRQKTTKKKFFAENLSTVIFAKKKWKFLTCYSPGQCSQKNYLRTMNMCVKCVYPQSRQKTTKKNKFLFFAEDPKTHWKKFLHIKAKKKNFASPYRVGSGGRGEWRGTP